MNKSTTNYEQFKFIAKNRPIDRALVRSIMNSLRMRNMLDKYPITVNSHFEIVDGQHRFEACKALGIPVYYKVDNEITDEDLIHLNTSKSWAISDYYNYYLTSNNENYVKLERFIKEVGITLRIALNVVGVSKSREKMEDFKKGKFVFNKTDDIEDLKIVQETRKILQTNHGTQNFTNSSKFWSGMLFLIRAPEFNKEHWYKNVEKMSSRFTSQLTTREFLKFFISIFNYYMPNEKKLAIDKFTDFSGGSAY